MAKERSKHSPCKVGAWAIIYCASTDKFLLGKRSRAVNNSGVWNLFGGRVERGEAPCKALVRELVEEAGIQVKPKHLSKLTRVEASKSQGGGGRDLHYFVLTLEHELVPRLNREHSRYRWFEANCLPVKFNFPTTVAIERGLLSQVRA